MTANNYPPFQTVKQAVKSTGFSERFIRKCVRDGTAPHIMAGTKVLLNVPAFLSIMDERSRGEVNADR